MESAATIKQVRERDQLRRIFNRTATTVEALIGDQNLLQARIDIDFLQDKFTRLETLQNSIQDSMLGSDKYDEAEFAKEIDMADKFRYRWCTIRNQVQTGISKDNTVDQTVDKKQLRNLRLPHLEVKKFDDNPKNWLAFWGQFKKINEDKDIIEVDKFQYLIQSLKEDSSARALVESFPPSAENYIKAIEQLQARFGREDLLIQVYVRELLGLVLNNNKDSISVRELYDKLSTYLLSLETLGIVKQKYETILYPLVESAIPETILVAWNRSKADHSKDQLANLLNFLKSEVETEERIKLARSEFNCARTNTTFHRESGSSLPTAASLVSNVKQKESGKELNTCCFCDKGGHNSLECSKGNKMSLDDKKEAIKGKGCCYICLKKGHMANRCKLFIKCIACNKRHFTILCPELHRRENTKAPPENVLVCARSNTTTLLQTLVVNITHKGKSKKVRVLLDSGSQRSYVKAALAKELGLQQTGTEKIGHTLFGGVERPAQVYKCYDIMVSSLDNSFVTKINALQQSEICGHLPKIKTMYLSKKLQNLNIKISDFDYPDTEIGILVGSDFLGSIITNKLVNLGNNLIAVYTYLGWTLQGPIEVQSTVNTISVSCFSKTNLEDLWSVELLGIQDPYEKQSRKETETDILNVFNNNISVNAQGRYEVSLLWKEGCPGLSTNYEVACKRLESTTKKLKSTGNLKIYNHVLQEWKKDDIIEKVTDDNTEVGHYIPHHSVIKPSSTSTRVRPVYDASAKDKNGWSLNSCLDKGINMIELLPKLLIQFRKGAYGVVSDIKQAFLQIAITEKDRNYLKFLWWDDIETCDKIVTYRHKRVVFGITCSPFLLSATIRYHLERCADAQKHTANKLKESFYVDNCVTSFETVDELNTFITESRTIMAEGMFDLRAWVTAPHRIGDSVSVPVLGMTWNTLQDDLRCNVNIKETTPQKITKRYVISVAQHVFDPLGFVCCATLIPKLVMQKIWEHKVDWDQEIPTDLAQEFKNWLKTAHLINKCSFPRHLSAAPVEECGTSLHIFSDACQTSFAGCLFLRTQLNKKVEVQLVLAKNRVAPANRKMTLPRLELMGALIASRLYKEVIDSGLLAHCTNYKVYFWTDSAVVLAWIKRNNQWKTFVSNRVEEICTTTHRDDWHHIPGEFNQADLPSRGCDAKKLLESRWWEGPAWLKLDINNWPKSSISNVNEEDVQAEASQNIMVNTNIMPVELFSQRLMHFSKYNRIVRLVAWILRMSCNVRRKFNVKQPDITNDEYINAEKSLFKLLQRENFTPEKLPKNLNTELDTEGILKVKTRLDLGEEDRNFVQPVLLPGRNEIVQRLIRQRHEKLNHAGTQLIMTDLRSNLWILNLRRVAKSTVSKCVICRRYKAKRYEVPEAPLPADRIDTKAVFEVTGIDLAGPLYLRDQGKCWIVLFTCATYRAVHLELVESLSTNSFLMALRRFIARRGRVRVIYTDCGGNFQGTSNLLNTVRWTEVEAASATLVTPIRWRFLPPRTPWWGGWWERLIKILKDMLRRILGKESVTWIELSTLLCDCEAVMNSRPLTYVATTDDCLTPLTPMMFLHSLPSSDTPDLDQIDDKNMNIRLQYLHKLRDDFRCRFRKEYLGLLCSKDKCKQNLPKVNDIVLIETDSSRLYWPLGIIKELLAGTDGHSRVAKVQTATGEWIRAVQRLYPLELSAVTDEWQRTIASTKGKPESDYLSQQVSPDANSNSDLSDDVRPTSTSTKRGRIVKVPRRFLD